MNESCIYGGRLGCHPGCSLYLNYKEVFLSSSGVATGPLGYSLTPPLVCPLAKLGQWQNYQGHSELSQVLAPAYSTPPLC